MSKYQVGDRVQVACGDVGFAESRQYLDRLEELNRGSAFGVYSSSLCLGGPLPYNMEFATITAIPAFTVFRDKLAWLGFNDTSAGPYRHRH